MRVSNHPGRLSVVAAAIAGLLLAGCGPDAAASQAVQPSVAPTPVVTPDPHLKDPATADQVFDALRRGDLPLSVNNATSGDPNSPVAKRINAALANWPLIVTEYRSSAQLRDALAWDPTKPPANGNAPYTFVGMNILIEFGPATGIPTVPDEARQQQARDVIALIDPLLWPIEQRSVEHVPVRTPEPGNATPPAGSPGTSPSPGASTAP